MAYAPLHTRLTEADLPRLSERLQLSEGWEFQARHSPGTSRHDPWE